MRTRWYEILGLGLLLLLFALLSTFPLVHYFSTAIPFGSFRAEINWNKSGDHLQLLYWFWLVKENILGNVPFDSNPFEFIMPVQHATTGLITFPFSLLYTLFSPLGDISAYNCTLLSSYFLTGLFMYLLVRLYRGKRTGALLAAIIFTFAPSRINGIAGGNLYGFLFFCYPWILYFLEKGIQTQRIRYGILSALGLFFLSMLEAHLLYYLLLFLAIYLPFRCLLICFPQQETPSAEKRILETCTQETGIRLSSKMLVLCIWIAGLIVVGYSQVLFTFRDQGELITRFSLWIFTLYPLAFLFAALWIALLLQRLLPMGFKRTLSCMSFTSLPLYICLLFAFLAIVGKPVATKHIILFCLVIVPLSACFFLRKHLFSFLKSLIRSLTAQRKQIYPIVPLVLAIVYVVFWIPKAKTEKIASTIAEGGRTLADVQLYSAKISDIFAQTSNVYLGKIALLLLGLFFIFILWNVLKRTRHVTLSSNHGLLTLFYALTAFTGYILALGLAFGQSSLYLFLYNYLPYFKYPRISDRMMVLALFAAAIAAGLVLSAIKERIEKQFHGKVFRYGALFGVLLVILYQLQDYGITHHMGITRLDQGQSIYQYVHENRGDKILLELPLWPGDSHQSSLYEHYIMLDKVPRVNGYSPLVKRDYVDSVFHPLFTLNRGRINAKQYALLCQLHVGYITVHNNRDVFPEKVSPFPPLTTIRRLQTSPYLEQVSIENTMALPQGNLQRSTLALFRVKSPTEIAAETKTTEERYGHYDMPFLYDASYRLRNQTGERIDDKKLGKPVFHAQEGVHAKGYLVRGPFSSFAEGSYRCYFSLNLKEASGNLNDTLATLEVVKVSGKEGEKILAEKDLTASQSTRDYRRIPLDFSLDSFSKLEFRIFYHGKGELWADTIAVYPDDSFQPIYRMAAYKMVGEVGRILRLDDAKKTPIIDGQGPLVTDDGNEILTPVEGDLVYGPNRIFNRGIYRVQFVLRRGFNISDTSNQVQSQAMTEEKPAAVLQVTDGMGKRIFAQKKLSSDQIQTSFETFEISFTLQRQEELSFHIFSTAKVDLQVKEIELQELPPVSIDSLSPNRTTLDFSPK